MKRRSFLKSIAGAAAALPLLSLISQAHGRERIYLKRGEVLQGRTFTRDVEVWADEDATIRACYFDKAKLYAKGYNGGEAQRLTIADNVFLGDYTGSNSPVELLPSRWGRFENNALGTRYWG